MQHWPKRAFPSAIFSLFRISDGVHQTCIPPRKVLFFWRSGGLRQTRISARNSIIFPAYRPSCRKPAFPHASLSFFWDIWYLGHNLHFSLQGYPFFGIFDILAKTGIFPCKVILFLGYLIYWPKRALFLATLSFFWNI